MSGARRQRYKVPYNMKVYAPNIHLFAFLLYKGSNIKHAQANDVNYLWLSAENIVKEALGKDLRLSECIDSQKARNSPRVDLLKESLVTDGDYSLPFTGNNPQLGLIKGFAYPLRLHDSYGLWLNLRRPEFEDDGKTKTVDVDIALLSQLNPNNCLTLEKTNFFLGQTLLITAWLTSDEDKHNPNQVALECLKSLFQTNDNLPTLNRQGELFGSPIFEYGLFSQLAHYQHILIWLFSDGKADEKFNLCYQELLDLFFYRTKVVKAFQDSRAIYRLLADSYQEIESFLDNLPQIDENQALTTGDLNQLKNHLKSLPQLALKYTRLLRNLEDYQNTIAINQYNYSEKIQGIRGIVGGEDLHFLETFTQSSVPYFQKQIQADLGYYRHGSMLLEQAIASIRGLVEIEVAEREGSLEKTIQIVGVGLGAGALVSGVVTQHIDKINQPLAAISPSNPPHPFYASLLLSIVATLFFAGIAWLWTKRK
jgi:hypothetical protein